MAIAACALIVTSLLTIGQAQAMISYFPAKYQITNNIVASLNADADSDSSGNLVAVYERDNKIYLRTNRGVEQYVADGNNPSVAVDGAGIAHVVYLSGGNVMYKKITEGSEPFNFGAGDFVTVDTDSDNSAWIAYAKTGGDGYSDIYLSQDGIEPSQILDGQLLGGEVPQSFTNPVIKIDGNDKYHIAYLAAVNGSNYARIETNVAGGNSTSGAFGGNITLTKNGLALDASNKDNLVYTDGDFIYYALVSDVTFSGSQIVESTVANPAIDIYGGVIGIAYEETLGSTYAKYTENLGVTIVSVDSAAAANPAVVLNGTRNVYYQSSGNVYLGTNTIIIDTNPPVITLTGSSTVSVTVGDTYEDAGATAFDTEGGDLTGSLVINNPVDTAVVGSYTITYNVMDAAENSAAEVTRTVNVVAAPDTVAPVITLTGSASVSLYVGDTYSDAGATANDDVDGNITANIVTNNPVNTSVAGTYTVTYSVSDAAGNPAVQVTRSVVVASRPGSGGGGGGYIGTPTIPTSITAVNMPLTIGPTQSGLLTQTFADGNKVDIQVPTGAVSSQTTFNVTEGSLDYNNSPVNTEGAFLIGGQVFNITAIGPNNAEVHGFNKLLTITITIPGMTDVANLNLYYFNESSGKWQKIDSAVFDGVTGKVTFTVDHLTKFAIFRTASNQPNLTTAAQPVNTVKPQVLGVKVYNFKRNLGYGIRHADVKTLQTFLIEINTGKAAKALAKVGATGKFGLLTRSALAEYQKKARISPAVGYFGIKTRTYINNLK